MVQGQGSTVQGQGSTAQGPGWTTQGQGSTAQGQGTAGTVVQVPPPAESSHGGGLRVAGWAIGGVGVAGLAMGGVLAYYASKDFSDVETKYNPDKYNQGKRYVTYEVISFCLGGAAIATGVILLVTGRNTPVAVTPAVGPGLAGAALSGTF